MRYFLVFVSASTHPHEDRRLDRAVVALCQLAVYGDKPSVERVASFASFSTGTITRTGTMRKIPDPDSWCYSTAWYRFDLDSINEELRDFLFVHGRVRDVTITVGITYAFLTLCPVEQSYEHTFACVLERETLEAIWQLGLALQIAPASTMPDAPFWNSGASVT